MKYSIVICLFLLTFTVTVHGQDKCNIPGVLLKDMGGKMVSSTEAIKKGEPIIICFWASWCHPCIKELSAIAEVYKEWQNETGVILYAISVDDSRSFVNARVMINNNSWPFEFYFDTNSDFKRAMGVVNIPHTFVLNDKGEVIYQHISYVEGSEVQIISKIREMKQK
jgi:cytochrome c biogenesis protein CcmG, thiol:disulfide interchange protein DsbE